VDSGVLLEHGRSAKALKNAELEFASACSSTHAPCHEKIVSPNPMDVRVRLWAESNGQAVQVRERSRDASQGDDAPAIAPL
jgi:hypothetical protein